MAEQAPLTGPNLRTEGVAASELREGEMLLGHDGEKPVVIARTGGAVFAVSGKCTHYGGPLGKGLFDGDLVRCPWHHACFSVRTGRAERAPALNPLSRYEVREEDGTLFVGDSLEADWEPGPIADPPSSVVVLGAGAAAAAAVEELRAEGYEGPITMVGAESTVPVDRPNLSKDYLAGEAPEEWIPLRSAETYASWGIELRLDTEVTAIDVEGRSLSLAGGESLPYGALLIATGAEPVRLPVPGADRDHVHYLRTLADSRAIIAAAGDAGAAVVVGASFIGLEVAASLRNRDLEVHVVAPEEVPMEPVLGREMGEFVRGLHEDHGVRFHLGRTVASIGEGDVELDDESRLAAALVVVGIGVQPRVALAEEAGLDVDDGIVVDTFLATSAPGVWAAGDVARYPDPRLGRPIRVEHWVVAQRQGQAAARNILGRRRPFTDAPFFWSQHYDLPINYVGHATDWDAAEVSGSIADRDALVAYREGGDITAVATIHRDDASLAAAWAMERNDLAALEDL